MFKCVGTLSLKKSKVFDIYEFLAFKMQFFLEGWTGRREGKNITVSLNIVCKFPLFLVHTFLIFWNTNDNFLIVQQKINFTF